MTDVTVQVLDLMRHTLRIPENFALAMNLSPVQVPGWDSLGWVNLIAGIENQFKVELQFDELEKVYNVGQLCELVNRTLAARA